jgi:2-polyprenyl-6-methoxyphenol hydroxylase-like FAD-dependent oxidoreductase
VNTGFHLWSFAIRCLHRLGLSALDDLGAPLERVVTNRSDGRLLSAIDLGPFNRKLGAANYDVHRARLQARLADLVGRTSTRLSTPCVAVEQDEHTATAVAGDGTRFVGDLVVAADGVHSSVRRQLLPNIAVRRSIYGAWRGLVAGIPARAVPDGTHLRVMGARGIFGGGHLGPDEVRWYAAAPVPAAEGASVKEQALQTFGAWCDPVGELIEATSADDLLYNDTPYIDPLPRWVFGRVALLGDAAHAALPSLATGGAAAIEDADVLGECVARAPSLPDALRAYDAQRRPVATRLQRRSERAAQLFGTLTSPPLVWMRDQLLTKPTAPMQRAVISRLMNGRPW